MCLKCLIFLLCCFLCIFKTKIEVNFQCDSYGITTISSWITVQSNFFLSFNLCTDRLYYPIPLIAITLQDPLWNKYIKQKRLKPWCRRNFFFCDLVSILKSIISNQSSSNSNVPVKLMLKKKFVQNTQHYEHLTWLLCRQRDPTVRTRSTSTFIWHKSSNHRN